MANNSNLRRGNPGNKGGRPRKTIRQRWGAIGERALKVAEHFVAEAEAEIKDAKAKNRKPRVDRDYILKVADVATKHSEGQKVEHAVSAVPHEATEAAIARVYGPDANEDAHGAEEP